MAPYLLGSSCQASLAAVPVVPTSNLADLCAIPYQVQIVAFLGFPHETTNKICSPSGFYLVLHNFLF